MTRYSGITNDQGRPVLGFAIEVRDDEMHAIVRDLASVELSNRSRVVRRAVEGRAGRVLDRLIARSEDQGMPVRHATRTHRWDYNPLVQVHTLVTWVELDLPPGVTRPSDEPQPSPTP